MTTLTTPEVAKNASGEGWNVEQFDHEGACLLTHFIGPHAEQRAKYYAAAMQIGQFLTWRVKDFADGWIYFGNEAAARTEAKDTTQLIQQWDGFNGVWKDAEKK